MTKQLSYFCRNNDLNKIKKIYFDEISDGDILANMLVCCKKGYFDIFKFLSSIKKIDIHMNNDKLFVTSCIHDSIEIAKFIYQFDDQLKFSDGAGSIKFFIQNNGTITTINKNINKKNIKTDIDFYNIMDIVCRNNSAKIVKWLIKEYDESIKIDELLKKCIRHSKKNCFELLISLYDDEKVCVDNLKIICAYCYESPDLIKILLDNEYCHDEMLDVINDKINTGCQYDDITIIKILLSICPLISLDISCVIEICCQNNAYSCLVHLLNYVHKNNIDVEINNDEQLHFGDILEFLCQNDKFGEIDLLMKSIKDIDSIPGINNIFENFCHQHNINVVKILNKYLDYYVVEYVNKRVKFHLMKFDIWELKREINNTEKKISNLKYKIEKFDNESHCLICFSSDEKYYVNYNCNNKHNHYYCIDCLEKYTNPQCLICMKDRHIKKIKICYNE